MLPLFLHTRKKIFFSLGKGFLLFPHEHSAAAGFSILLPTPLFSLNQSTNSHAFEYSSLRWQPLCFLFRRNLFPVTCGLSFSNCSQQFGNLIFPLLPSVGVPPHFLFPNCSPYIRSESRFSEVASPLRGIRLRTRRLQHHSASFCEFSPLRDCKSFSLESYAGLSFLCHIIADS